MAISRGRYRTAASTGTLVALILVLIFGSPWYVDWVHAASRGLFLETLAWPSWAFNSNLTVRDLIARDLRAILLVVFTYVFISAMAGSQLAKARGGISAFLVGWAAYIFAAALAALLTAFIAASAPANSAVLAATSGASYALIVGWIVGLASMAGRRP